MVISMIEQLTQKDIGYLVFIGEYEEWNNFLSKDISLFCPKYDGYLKDELANSERC